ALLAGAPSRRDAKEPAPPVGQKRVEGDGPVTARGGLAEGGEPASTRLLLAGEGESLDLLTLPAEDGGPRGVDEQEGAVGQCRETAGEPLPKPCDARRDIADPDRDARRDGAGGEGLTRPESQNAGQEGRPESHVREPKYTGQERRGRGLSGRSGCIRAGEAAAATLSSGRLAAGATGAAGAGRD